MTITEKKVYVGMAADIIHEGHLNIIAEARKYGYVIVGVLTDEAIASYKRIPFTPYKHRKAIVENLKGVEEVIPQESLDYVPNLQKIKPDILVHGDDWKTGVQQKTRQRAIDALAEWGGELIEPKYTKGVSSTQLIEALKEKGITPNMRLKSLRLMLDVKPVLRVMEAHNGITGLIVEKAKVHEDGGIREFDALWLSSLTVSTSKGKPDTEVVDFYSIGTNDLTQYLFSIERTHPLLKADELSPVVFSAIEVIVKQATKPVSICGELAGNTDALSKLIDIGLETLSVSPKSIAQTKEHIRHV